MFKVLFPYNKSDLELGTVQGCSSVPQSLVFLRVKLNMTKVDWLWIHCVKAEGYHISWGQGRFHHHARIALSIRFHWRTHFLYRWDTPFELVEFVITIQVGRQFHSA